MLPQTEIPDTTDEMFPKLAGFVSHIHWGKNLWEMFGKRKALSEDLHGDWKNLLSVTFKEDKSDFFFLPVKPSSSSSGLPISATGDIRCASLPRGESQCAAAFNKSFPKAGQDESKNMFFTSKSL